MRCHKRLRQGSSPCRPGYLKNQTRLDYGSSDRSGRRLERLSSHASSSGLYQPIAFSTELQVAKDSESHNAWKSTRPRSLCFVMRLSRRFLIPGRLTALPSVPDTLLSSPNITFLCVRRASVISNASAADRAVSMSNFLLLNIAGLPGFLLTKRVKGTASFLFVVVLSYASVTLYRNLSALQISTPFSFVPKCPWCNHDGLLPFRIQPVTRFRIQCGSLKYCCSDTLGCIGLPRGRIMMACETQDKLAEKLARSIA